jgi:hypothetical protein
MAMLFEKISVCFPVDHCERRRYPFSFGDPGSKITHYIARMKTDAASGLCGGMDVLVQ